MTHACLPLLCKSAHPVLVNVSSGMGSFTLTHEAGRIELGTDGPTGTFRDRHGALGLNPERARHEGYAVTPFPRWAARVA